MPPAESVATRLPEDEIAECKSQTVKSHRDRPRGQVKAPETEQWKAEGGVNCKWSKQSEKRQQERPKGRTPC